MTLGDRIVIMKDGLIQQVGTPQEVFDAPANLFVAGFIGSPQMNFLDAKLELYGHTYEAVLSHDNGQARIRLPDAAQQKLADKKTSSGQSVIVGIRPEHIKLSDDAEGGLTGRIDVSEMMGSEVYLHTLTDGTEVILRVPTAELPPERRSGFPRGMSVSFVFPADLIHIFDNQSEANLLS